MDMNEAKRDRLVAETRSAASDQLRAERAASKLTIDSVAAMAGINRKTVMRLESGESTPTVAQLAALCATYGLDIADFMARTQERIDQAHRAFTPERDAGNVSR